MTVPRGPRDRLVFPLDVRTRSEAERWIACLAKEVGVFKVGLELFTAEGPAAVEAVHAAGADCFLDLKLHDSPATVEGAVRSAVALGVRFLTVHAASGVAALEAAARVTAGSSTQLLGVTVLTSMDGPSLAAIGALANPAQLVQKRAAICIEAGIDGLVCSAAECGLLRHAFGPTPLLVVPGIRPDGAPAGDQRRVSTPRAAIADGASLLVVGRPIREASNPVLTARAIVAEIAEAAR
jgi:orotidine-5'-phosphate decarboxylase